MKRTDTKTTLLDCAEDLIQRRGINAMSYNDLSKAVGIAKASIHHHFPKKEDMLLALMSKYACSYAEQYVSIVDSNKEALDKLKAIADIFENSLKQNKICLFGMISSEQGSLSEPIQEMLKEGFDGTVLLFEKVFIQGIEDKTISSDLDSRQSAQCFLSLLIGAQITARSQGDSDSQIFSSMINEYLNLLER